MFFKHANSVEEQLLNFRNTSVSHCFRILSLTIISNNLGLSNFKRIKMNLEFRKNTYFINVQQNIIPRMVEWLRDATNTLE